MAIFKNSLLAVAVVAVVAVGTVSATPVDTSTSLVPRNGCYSKGPTWEYAGFNNADWISGACSRLTGSYATGQIFSICLPGSNPNQPEHVNFSIQNNSGNSASLSESDCVYAATREYDACDHGSEQQYGSFHYVLDPNDGSC